MPRTQRHNRVMGQPERRNFWEGRAASPGIVYQLLWVAPVSGPETDTVIALWGGLLKFLIEY